MGRIYIDVDENEVLGELSTSDIINELGSRRLHNDEKHELVDLLVGYDVGKIRLFLSVEEKYTLAELQAIFSEPPATISENQLPLFASPTSTI